MANSAKPGAPGVHCCGTQSPQTIPDSGIGEVVITSRGLDEYRAMFALSATDLDATILDCPGGASSATAEINAAGGRSIAADPFYGRQFTAADLASYIQSETDRGNAYVRDHPDEYRWTFFGSPEHHHQSRSQAGRLFVRDYCANPDNYVAAELPQLPFPTHAFDLVLSSHLLFTYADRFSPAFHHQAINELMRVTRTELRIFPLVVMGSIRYDLDDLLAGLRADGVHGEVVAVDYEFQAGGNQMLVCTRADAATRVS
ncbi:methyltransferase domain-containing protein [Mycobacterium haemophilum]|uniref:methyltransferase domain-containing protein n=1 Tax=Mycobacterium haemophilum TaxID=29311 RepID=UPI000B140315